MSYRIAAIPGSTKEDSTHLRLLKVIQLDFHDVTFDIYTGISNLPHFNPDHDRDTPHESVRSFREKLRSAEAILICTPEYAMGVPGTLKNALDWTVSSAEFYEKPVALITASTVGEKGHRALMETLLIMGSKIAPDAHTIISSIKSRAPGGVPDPAARTTMQKVVRSLIDEINRQKIAGVKTA
ncbi:MAG: NAD(P)H-dependent oxidoreductase [Bacteroidetes bacterium]|nr:NAD(P)H-dependent oxidoreductase [Bacteroidota bacterium]